MEKGNRYKITLTDRHSVLEEKSENTIIVRGDLDFKPEEYTITYLEHAGDMAGSTTKVRVKKGKLIQLSRSGPYSTDLVLELGKRHTCQYATPYGSLMMGVYTDSIESDMTENGGHLRFKYSLDVGGGEVTENDLELTVDKLPDDRGIINV